MDPKETGQAQETGKPDGLESVWKGDFWEKGLEKFDEKPAEKAEAKPEEDCPTCPKAKKAAEDKAAAPATEEKKPFRVLKVKGKDVPVSSEEEFIALAQKGLDYTQKTTAVADERRKIEAERGQMGALVEKMDAILARIGEAKGEAKPPAERAAAPEPEKSPFEEFGLDPELADDWQKSMVLNAAKMRKENLSLKEQFAQIQPMMQMLMVEKLFTGVQNRIKDTIKDFPIEDIKDENGRSLTEAQFNSLIVQKAQADPKRPLDELAAETVMEIHEAQTRTRESATAALEKDRVTDEADIEVVKAKYPNLFKKIADKGVAEYLSTKEDLPPTLKGKGKEASAGQNGKRQVKETASGNAIDDALEAGFNDPKFLENLG